MNKNTFLAYCDFIKEITTLLSLETKSLDTYSKVRVYNNYDLIALQGLDTDDIEGCEFSKKFRAETIGDIEKLMACVGH